ESLLDLFEQEGVTFAGGVPTIWLGILQALEAYPKRWKLAPDLKMVVGGSAAPESMIRAFDRLGMQVVHAWGMTGMSPLGTVSRPLAHHRDLSEDERLKIRAKQGTPSPFVDIRAVGDKGEVPWDGKTPGELEVRGPWVASRYYDNDEQADRFTKDGWFK